MKRCLTLVFLSSLAFACGRPDSSPTSPPRERGSPRELNLATGQELEGRIFLGLFGETPITNGGSYKVRLFPQGTYHKGSDDNRILTAASGGSIETTIAPNGTFGWNDGFAAGGAGSGLVWNGLWTVQLTTSSGEICSVPVAVNHIHASTRVANGNFLDIAAGDQEVNFRVTTSGECLDAEVLPDPDPVHPKPSSPLKAGFPPGTPPIIQLYIGEPFTLRAVPSGGHSHGTKKFAWKVSVAPANTGATVDFGPNASFTTDSDTILSFTGDELYVVRYVVRDGNDAMGQGGNYALSVPCYFNVIPRPTLGAKAAGNYLPGTATQYTWYATSVMMKNVGTETWSGSAFSLGQMPNQHWSPTAVSLGTGSVATDQTKTFNYNMGMMMGPYTGWQNNYWKVRKSGVAFGDSNGTKTFVKAGTPEARSPLDWTRFLGLFSPRAALAAAGFLSQDEVMHQVEILDMPLPVADIIATGRFMLRYESALAEPWDVDFRLYVEYDPAVFELGKVKQGVRGQGHRINVQELGAGQAAIRGIRVGGGKLQGEGLIFEVPLELKPGVAVPTTLPRVELTASR